MDSKKLKRFLSVVLSLSMVAPWNMANVSASGSASADTSHVQKADAYVQGANGHGQEADAHKQEANGHKHDWELLQTVQGATCLAEGTGLYECVSGCGQTEYLPIPATGHSYEAEGFDKGLPGNFKVTKEATCTEAGAKEYTCTNEGCTEETEGHVKEEGIPAAGHVWSEEESIQEATDTEPGYTYIECAVCHEIQEGSKKIQESSKKGLPAETKEPAEEPVDGPTQEGLADPAQEDPAQEPTQEAPAEVGEPAMVKPAAPQKKLMAPAADAGIATVEDVGAATCNHVVDVEGTTLAFAKVFVAAACAQNGMNQYKCSVCNKSFNKAVPAHHKYQDEDETTKMPLYTTVDGKQVIRLRDENDEGFKEYIEKVEVNCLEKELTIYTCPECFDTYEVEGEVKQHTYPTVEEALGEEDPDIIREATCSTVGKIRLTCTGNCREGTLNRTKIEDIPLSDNHADKVTASGGTADHENPGGTGWYCYVCKRSEGDIVLPKGHDYEVKDAEGNPVRDENGQTQVNEDFEDKVIVEATCRQKGSITYKCSCGKDKTVEVPKSGHKPTEGKSGTIPATCKENARHTEACSVCGQEYSQDIVEYYMLTDEIGEAEAIAKADGLHQLKNESHEWECETIYKDAGCSVAGVAKYVCSVCGKVENRGVPKHHAYMDNLGKVSRGYIQEYPNMVDRLEDATCLEAGSATITCNVCGETEENVALEALGHDFQPDTEEEDELYPNGICNIGLEKSTCSRCKETSEKTLPVKQNHDYQQKTIDPTCTENSKTGEYCTYCHEEKPGTEAVENENTATGHIFEKDGGDGKVVDLDYIKENDVEIDDSGAPGTCLESGTIGYYCDNCEGFIYYTVEAKESHDWADAAEEEATCQHDKQLVERCNDCGAINEETLINFKDLYDSEEEAREAGVVQTDHNWKVKTVVKEATCTANGLAVMECTMCHNTRNAASPAYHKTFQDVNGELLEGAEHTALRQADCEQTGIDIYHCGVCDKDIEVEAAPATGHKYGRATSSWPNGACQPGTKVSKCSICQKEKAEEAAPRIDHPYEEVETEASCTEPAKKGKVCSICGTEDPENPATAVPGSKAKGHSYQKVDAEGNPMAADGKSVIKDAYLSHPEDYPEEVEVESATCMNDGKITYTCKDCGKIEEMPVDSLGHILVQDTFIPANCQSDAKITYKCARVGCEDEIPADEKEELHPELGAQDPDAHDMQPATNAPDYLAATCTADGHATLVCQVENCTEVRENVVLPAGHVWEGQEVKPVEIDGTAVASTQKCKNCEQIRTVGKVADGYALCDGCNKVVKVTVYNAEEADCTNDGSTGNQYCPDCKRLLQESQPIKAHGHVYRWAVEKEPTCGEGTEVEQCIYNKEHTRGTRSIPAIDDNHDYTKLKYTDPETCGEYATFRYVCSRCDADKPGDVPVIVEGSRLEHNFVNGECVICQAKELRAEMDTYQENGKNMVKFTAYVRIDDPGQVEEKGLLFVIVADYAGGELTVEAVGSVVKKSVATASDMVYWSKLISVGKNTDRVLYARPYIKLKGGETLYGDMVYGSYNEPNQHSK